LLAYFCIFLLHIQLRSICLFICALILIVLTEVGIILRQELVLNSRELLALDSSIRSLRHHLLLAQRNVEQIEQSQIHLRVDLELAIFLQDAQNAQFPVKYEILVSLDQYVCDRHDAVFQCFDLQFLEQLWSGNLFAGCLDARIDQVAVLSGCNRGIASSASSSVCSTSCSSISLEIVTCLSHLVLLIIEESNIVIQYFQQAVYVVLLNTLPLDALILCDFENRGCQQILYWRLRLLNDIPEAIKHIAQAVRLAFIVEHFVQEDIGRLVAEQVWVKGRNLA